MLTKLLIFGSRTIRAEAVGTAIDEEDAIGFSALRAVRPMIERISLAKAPEAHAKMIRNEARFRMIIDFSLRTRRGRATDGERRPEQFENRLTLRVLQRGKDLARDVNHRIALPQT